MQKTFIFLLLTLLLVSAASAYNYEDFITEEEQSHEIASVDEINSLFWRGARRFFRRAKRTVKRTWKRAKRGAKRTWKRAKRGAKRAWKHTKRGAKRAWKHAKKGAKKSYTWIKKQINYEVRMRKQEIKTCRRYSRVPRNEIQYETESIALIASGVVYRNSKKFDLQDMEFDKESLDYLYDWENIMTISRGSMKALILVNHETYEFVVAFRGTLKVSYKDWITNLKFWRVHNPWGSGTVHKGFLKEIVQILRVSKFKKKIDELLLDEYRPILTGHSQGAGEALIFSNYILKRASQLKLAKPNVAVVLFSAPRSGNKDFAVSTMKKIKNIVRFQNSNDKIPLLPLMVFRYHHAGIRSENDCHHGSVKCHTVRLIYRFESRGKLKNYLPPRRIICNGIKKKKIFGGLC